MEGERELGGKEAQKKMGVGGGASREVREKNGIEEPLGAAEFLFVFCQRCRKN